MKEQKTLKVIDPTPIHIVCSYYVLGKDKSQIWTRLISFLFVFVIAVYHHAKNSNFSYFVVELMFIINLATFLIYRVCKKGFLKNEGGRVYSKIYGYFFKDSIQRAWIDSLSYCIIFGLIWSIQVSGCEFLDQCSDSQHFDKVLIVWNFVALVMSMILTHYYYGASLDHFEKISVNCVKIGHPIILHKRSVNFFSIVCILIVFFNILILFMSIEQINNNFKLVASFILFFAANKDIFSLYTLWIVIFIFICMDLYFLRLFQEQRADVEASDLICRISSDLSANNSIKLDSLSSRDRRYLKLKKYKGFFSFEKQDSVMLSSAGIAWCEDKNNAHFEKYLRESICAIDKYINSIFLANAPALIGFMLLIFIANSMRQEGNTVSSVIAGGTAMHLIFGNFVASTGLSDPQKTEVDS